MPRLIELLMVEDNPGDIRITQEYFKEYKIPNGLSVVKDSAEALRWLRHQGDYPSVTTPDILLLNSRVLLSSDAGIVELKAEAAQQSILLVVLTSSDGEENLWSDDPSIRLSLHKPLNLASLIALVKHVDDFWFSIKKSIE